MVSFKEIEKLFADQLSKIMDSQLAGKVVSAWVAACRLGEWADLDALCKLPFTVATNANGIGLIQHIKAATEGAVALARIQKEQIPDFPEIDMDILVAGALLNDINKVVVFERDGAGHYRKKAVSSDTLSEFPGVDVVRLAGLPGSVVDLVEYECRGSKGRPGNIETIFVQHADFITFDSMDYINTRF